MMTELDPAAPRLATERLIEGLWASLAVRAMATLGLADHLTQGPCSIEVLADATGLHAPSLNRLVRALTALGLCRDDGDGAGRVALTPMGDVLRTDAPESLRAYARMCTAPYVTRSWEELPSALRTGESPFPRIHGMGFWEFLAVYPDEGAIFDDAMTGGAESRARALLSARDLTTIGTVVDVGGGKGRLVAALLTAVPGLRGILADRPEVVAAAGAVLEAAAVADRCTVVATDFLAEVPAGGDAYVLALILHDWPDAEALDILRACHQAMATGARLWLVEHVLRPDDGRPDDQAADVALLDLTMLVLLGARERNEEDYRALLETAGFDDVTMFPAVTGPSVIEALRP